MAKTKLIRFLTIAYIIKSTLAEYFIFSNSDVSVSEKRKIVTRMGIFIIFVIYMLWLFSSFLI